MKEERRKEGEEDEGGKKERRKEGEEDEGG